MYNDIGTTIGRGNDAMLDLSAAFDTVDHDNLLYIIEKYVGICGNALKLIKLYFSNRTQRIQIDDVLSDFATIICGVLQASVLGPLKFCLYLLPMSVILKYRKIGYHVYADDTQLYISFKCKHPLEAISKVNSYLSDIRRWVIINKLKINDSKTEFIVFRSPQLRCDLRGLSVNVGESQIIITHYFIKAPCAHLISYSYISWVLKIAILCNIFDVISEKVIINVLMW